MKTVLVSAPDGAAVKVPLADGFLSRLRGLMGKKLRPGDALLLSPCARIHCCFMKSPIDAVYLGGDGSILALAEAMPPWSFGPRVPGARRVLELFAGDAGRLGLYPGMRLTIERCKK